MSMQKFNNAVVVEDGDPVVVGSVAERQARIEKAEPGYKPPVHGSLTEALGRPKAASMRDLVQPPEAQEEGGE